MGNYQSIDAKSTRSVMFRRRLFCITPTKHYVISDVLLLLLLLMVMMMMMPVMCTADSIPLATTQPGNSKRLFCVFLTKPLYIYFVFRYSVYANSKNYSSLTFVLYIDGKLLASAWHSSLRDRDSKNRKLKLWILDSVKHPDAVAVVATTS